MDLGEETQKKRRHLKGSKTFKPHSSFGKSSLLVCSINKHRKNFLNIREFNIFNFKFHEWDLLRNSASQNGLMIYEWHRDSKVFK